MALCRIVKGKRIQTWANSSMGDTVRVTSQLSPMMRAMGGIDVDTSDPVQAAKWGIVNLVDVRPVVNDMVQSVQRDSEELLGSDWVVTYSVGVHSEEQAVNNYSQAVEAYANEKAAERNYDSIRNAMAYAGYANPYQAEGEAYGKWLGDCWVACYAILADVQGEVRVPPTKAELIAELPVLVLP